MPVSVWHSHAGWGDGVDIDSLPHDYIAYSIKGEIECLRGGAVGRRAGPRSDILTLFRAGDSAYYISREETRFVHLNFTSSLWRVIAEELIGGRADQAELRPDSVFAIDRELRSQIDHYVGRAFCNLEPSSIEMDSRANLIALALLRRHSSLELSGEVRPYALAPARLQRVRDWIESHLDEDIGLADLSAAAGLSPFHFARAFKRETGLSPHRFLMDRRIDRARLLLINSDDSLAEIALSCGFAGQSSFTTAFKRYAGVTPGAWREALQS